jgi:hypothetical protein
MFFQATQLSFSRFSFDGLAASGPAFHSLQFTMSGRSSTARIEISLTILAPIDRNPPAEGSFSATIAKHVPLFSGGIIGVC